MPDTSITLTGNVTRDPELQFGQSGTAITKFGLALNSRRKDASGEWCDGDPQFFDVTCFNDLAENVAESIARGTRIVLSGRVSYSSWEKDGDKRSKVEVIADSIGPDLKWATAVV